MTNPWQRNAGKFDRPSSSLPEMMSRCVQSPAREPRADRDLDQRRDAIRYRGVQSIFDEVIAAADALDALDTPDQRATWIERHLSNATHDGVVAIGADTICARIDAAMQLLIDKGLGEARSIYLIDCDLLALREATGTAHNYRDLRVDRGAASNVWSKRGKVAVRRHRGKA